MAETKKIDQPSLDLQQLLDSVLEDSPTDVEFMGKKHTLRWLRNGAVRKFSHVTVTEKDENKRAVKLCAIVLLNNVWKLRFLYWLVWRWWYYVKDVDAVELLRVLDVAKKKIPSAAYSLLTILATGMTDVMMMKTKNE